MEKDSFAELLKNKDSQNVLEVVINELVRHENDYLSYTIGSKITPNLYVIVHLRRNFLLF